MKPRYLSLIPAPPAGFETGPVGKRELLSGIVVLLAPDRETACALLPDFCARVEGIVVTFGAPAVEQLGPLLWQVSLPREAADQGTPLLQIAREAIDRASQFRNAARVATLAQERLVAEQALRSEDYQRVTNALHEQVNLLAESEKKLQTILDSVDACIYLKDDRYRYLFANRAVRLLLGREAASIIGFEDSEFFDPATAEAIRRNDARVIDYGETLVTEETNTILASGKTITYRSTKIPLIDGEGRIYALCGISTDITLQKEREAHLQYLAHYDMLTALPNRVLLADRLNLAMTQARRRGQLLAVAYLDLDGFKVVNDRYGHGIGDQFLVALAGRLKQMLREGDTFARLGGDEFIAVLPDLPDSAAGVPLLTRLLANAAEPVQLGDLTLGVTASLGATFYPQADEVDADQLLRQADQAMYQAKLAGKNRFHLFDTEKDRSARGMHESLEHIRQALAARQFLLHYQPKVNMRSGEIIGVEALIRWQQPQRGLLPPGVFLPVIENHAMAVDLGEWVIDTALAQIDTWRSAGLDMPVSVNVCARHLLHPSFSARLFELLAQHPAIPPDRLEIEILETSALEDLAQVSRVIDECRSRGVRFSLDDFGTGYSSLSYLKRLPVDQIKLDRSFVNDMLVDPDDLTILDGVISLATAFDLQIIAEGVESTEHGSMLLQLGCEFGQGYGIAKPMPGNELQDWVENWRPDTLWRNTRPVPRDALPLLYAITEHRAWARDVEAAARTNRRDIPALRHPCQLGDWLRSARAERKISQATRRELERLHDKAHRLANELASGEAAGLPDQEQRLDAFGEAVDALVTGLQRAMEKRR